MQVSSVIVLCVLVFNLRDCASKPYDYGPPGYQFYVPYVGAYFPPQSGYGGYRNYGYFPKTHIHNPHCGHTPNSDNPYNYYNPYIPFDYDKMQESNDGSKEPMNIDENAEFINVERINDKSTDESKEVTDSGNIETNVETTEPETTPISTSTSTTSTTPTTTTTTTTTTEQPATTIQPEFDIDLRFKKPSQKRAIENFELSTRNFPANQRYPFWHYPHFEEEREPSSQLGTCVHKYFECVPRDECKSKSWNRHEKYCRWSGGEPYVCCEKSLGAPKFEGRDLKCGRRKSSKLSAALIGGVPVGEGTSYPWMAAIGERQGKDKIDWYCGGALINDRTIVTAAHCISRRSADLVRLGERDFSDGGDSEVQDIRVCEKIVHPSYKAPILYNDIALLVLDKPARLGASVKPVCLPERAMPDQSSLATLTGWGQRKFDGDRSSVLQQVTVKIFDNSQCDKFYSVAQTTKRNFPRGILDSQMCAGDDAGGKDACKGDSGGPLVVEDDGSFVLVGVVSAGIGCGSKNFPGIYTRVSSFVPWIYDNIVV